MSVRGKALYEFERDGDSRILKLGGKPELGVDQGINVKKQRSGGNKTGGDDFGSRTLRFTPLEELALELITYSTHTRLEKVSISPRKRGRYGLGHGRTERGGKKLFVERLQKPCFLWQLCGEKRFGLGLKGSGRKHHGGGGKHTIKGFGVKEEGEQALLACNAGDGSGTEKRQRCNSNHGK